MSLPRQTYKNRVENILPTHQKDTKGILMCL